LQTLLSNETKALDSGLFHFRARHNLFPALSMKSRAQFKSHPIHPILVSFPIAFFIGTFAFDILAYFTVSNDLANTARWTNIAGVAMGVLAAIPGLIDFVKVVPPNSSAKKRAATHGLTNSTVLVFFTVAYFLRDDEMSYAVIITIEGLATILLSVAGWMGGTLVYRNQIGVDIRYANAGRWKELELDEQNSIGIKDIDGLQENQMILIHARDKRIVLCKHDNNYIAFDDHCTHKGGSLAGGSLICGTVQCPWHGSQFDTRTGEVKAGPAKTKIVNYATSAEGNRLKIKL
jgi:uncharacterized membrane protein/nitrite reductase/ring-hydroxylating ferredoxin subunit